MRWLKRYLICWIDKVVFTVALGQLEVLDATEFDSEAKNTNPYLLTFETYVTHQILG